jgi:hypothetical protein
VRQQALLHVHPSAIALPGGRSFNATGIGFSNSSRHADVARSDARDYNAHRRKSELTTVKHSTDRRDSSGRLTGRQIGDILTEFDATQVVEIPLKMLDTRSSVVLELYDVRVRLRDGSELTLVKADLKEGTCKTYPSSVHAPVFTMDVTTYRLGSRRQFDTHYTFDNHQRVVDVTETATSADTAMPVKRETRKQVDASGCITKETSTFTSTTVDGDLAPEVTARVPLSASDSDGSTVHRITNQSTGRTVIQCLDVNGYLIKEATDGVSYDPINTADGTSLSVQTITFFKYEREERGRPIGRETSRRTFGGYQPSEHPIGDMTEATAISRNMPLLIEFTGPTTINASQWNGGIEFRSFRTIFSDKRQALGHKPAISRHNCFGFMEEETVGTYRTYYDSRSSFAVPLDERIAEAMRGRGMKVMSGRTNVNNSRVVETYRLYEWQARGEHPRSRAEVDMWHYAAMPDGRMVRDGRDDTRILDACHGLICQIRRGSNQPRDAQHRSYVLYSRSGEVVGSRTWFASKDGLVQSVVHEDWNATFDPNTFDLTMRRDHIA